MSRTQPGHPGDEMGERRHNATRSGRKSERGRASYNIKSYNIKEDAMRENSTTTLAWSSGHITVSDSAVAEVLIETLTRGRMNAVITIVWDDQTEERALIHDVAPEDLALERLAIEGVGDCSTLICEVLKLEQAPADDMLCPGCGTLLWWIAILEEAEDEHFTPYVRRLRTCRICGCQMTTQEMRSIGISNSNEEEGVMETDMQGRAISSRAKELISEGATDNPDGENTIVISELGWEATIFRIFRQRHTGGDPRKDADQWVWQVQERCTSLRGELSIRRIWSNSDGGSLTVAIAGQEIVAKEELESEM